MVNFNGEMKTGAHQVEEIDDTPIVQERRKYAPANDEEKALDRKINLKLDTIIIPLLACGFFLQGIDKSNIGNAATSPCKT
jgi:hypothetical protein